jgi:hypothetical protein
LFPWRKTEKPDPKVRVPELIQTLQNDKDEFNRSAAIVELRNYDASAFPDMIPALIGAVFTDTRAGVRIDAATTLAKVRPVSQTVGEALEQAMEKDVSMRVRLQARSSLLSYQWAGYRGGKKSETPTVSAVPAPVTRPAPVPAPVPAATERRSGLGGFFLPSVRTTPSPAGRPGGTAEPPLAPAREDKGPLLPPATNSTPRPVTPPTAPPTVPPTAPVEGPILP